MNAQFWNGKRVMVTGHTGFKGSWLSLWLQSKGADVIGYSMDPPSDPNFFEIGEIASGIKSINADVRDYKKLETSIGQYRPEIVIHLAAQPLVRYSYDKPLETFETNIMGTCNVLEAVRKTKCVKVVLIITSDKCYENKEWFWGYREDEPMGGHDPYSCSKGCAELVTAAYRRSYFPKENYLQHGVAVATARAGNVIGGGDWGQDRLVPDVMRAVIGNRTVEIRNPHAVRPWQFVLEPLDGYLCLVEKLWEDGRKYGGGWNFGPNEQGCKSVSWVLSKLDALWTGGVECKTDQSESPHEANYLKLDCGKARALLDWAPKLDLSTTLEMVVEWYEGYVNNENMRQLSERQLARYEEIGSL